MRVLVCGSRDYHDGNLVRRILDGYYSDYGHDLVLIEGGAQGADTSAAWWASHKLPLVNHLQFRADWKTHGKAAGPIRNQQMLDEGKPDVVWAFIDKPLEQSRGTFDMVTRAKLHDIPVYVVQKF